MNDAKPQPRYLKNPVTGVVFAETRLLKEKRKDLIPCTRAGVPIAPENVDMPMLYNPFTDVLVANNGDNSLTPGLIPCRDREHAEAIKAALMGTGGNSVNVVDVVPASKAGLTEPEKEDPTDIVTKDSDDSAVQMEPATGPDADKINVLRNIDVYKIDDKKELKAIVEEYLGETLPLNKGINTLREQVQVMINAEIAKAA